MDIIEKDVLVIGSGGAGMTAALVAAKHGLEVLLVEKTDQFGGTTAWSGGGIWAPNNSHGVRAGVGDSPDKALNYLRESIGPTVREDLLNAYISAVPEMVDFLEDNTEVQFALQPGFPDWYQEIDGAMEGGRLLSPENFDGRRLGDYLSRLRSPLAEFNAPGGMMVGLGDMPHIANIKSSWASFRHIMGIVLRYLWDKLRYGRGTRLTMGNALAARLLKSCVDAGVALWTDAPMLRLTTERGGVTGAIIRHNGRELTVRTKRGVVLASGGFSADPEMRAQFLPYPDFHVSLVNEGNTGDGIKNALALGANYDGENISNAGWVVISTLELPDGSLRKFPHLFLDRGKPGCIAINAEGKRFGNEATTNLVEPMHRTGSVPAFLIGDHRFIKKYGLGLVRPGGIGLKKMLAAGYVINAPTVAELAKKLGVDAVNLETTVARFNEQARKGIDSDFDRGAAKENWDMGDINHQPNPCLGALETAPYYAVKIYPGNSTTTVGLRVDTRARVLDGEGKPIPGLQAVGLDMNSLWRGKAPGHGSNNGLNLTFGYIAGKSLALET